MWLYGMFNYSRLARGYGMTMMHIIINIFYILVLLLDKVYSEKNITIITLSSGETESSL